MIFPEGPKALAYQGEPAVNYSSHISDYGWENFAKTDEETSGVIGQNKQVEAMKLQVENLPDNASISYQSHVQNVGWETEWAKNGETSGTENAGLRLEAFKIKLENAPGYSVQYRAYVEGSGWQPWVKDGQVAGTTSEGKRLEAFQVRIVPPNQPTVKYSSHVEDKGWEPSFSKKNGEMTGTVGKGLRLEAIQLDVDNLPSNAALSYQTHVQNNGWESTWKKNGEISGTTGKELRLEAIRIKLENVPDYTVEYRAQVQNVGWMPWVSNGEVAGTIGKGQRLEALEVRLVELDPQMNLDSPKSNGQFETDKNLIRGWVLAPEGVSKIDVLVDGQLQGQAKQVSRTDVDAAYPSYNTAAVGFEYPLDVSKISLGKHFVQVQVHLNNGVVKEMRQEITVKGLETIGYIDTPTANQVISGTKEVKGWILSPEPLSKVEVLVDGVTKGQATYGLSRPDVYQAVPAYNNSNAGYSYMLDTSGLSAGNHSVSVVSTSASGERFQMDTKFRIGTPVATNYQYMDIRYPSEVTAAEINTYIDAYVRQTGKQSVLVGQGQLLIDTATKAGINQLVFAAMAIHESGYGTNSLALEKYNLFSVAAYDSAKYDSAYTFSSVEQALQYQADFLRDGYLNPSSWKFKGYYLGDANGGLNYYYASDKLWGKKIADHMQRIHPFSPEEYSGVEIMDYQRYGVTLPYLYDDFTNMGITGIAKANIPLKSSYQGSTTVATLPAGASFEVLKKYNDHWFEIKYNNQIYYYKVGMSDYYNYFTITNLLRAPDFTYSRQVDPKVIPPGYVTVYR